MNDRNGISRGTKLNGYGGHTGGYGKGGFKDGGRYKGHGGPGAALIAANQPKKKTVRPVQLSSLKSETSDSYTSTQSGWGQAKKETLPKQETRVAPTAVASRPWSSGSRGVPGLNQPEPARKELTSLGSSTRNPSQKDDAPSATSAKAASASSSATDQHPRKLNPMLPTYMQPPPTQNQPSSQPTRPANTTASLTKKHHDSSEGRSDDSDDYRGADDAGLDWADDKPMDWSEKIIFSDDDVSAAASAKATPTPEPTPPPPPVEETEHDRYDNYDRNRGRSYNHRHLETHYENRRYRHQQPMNNQQGFYDDHERQFYANDLEKSKEDLFHRRRDRRPSARSSNNEIEENSPVEMMITEDQPAEPQPKRKIVVRRNHKALRDFTNEEKGEEGLDEIEPEEKQEKHIRPRGWKTEEEQRAQRDEKKEKENRKIAKKHHKDDHKVKMPTADGSRASRLDRDNAEKEAKNKNVWAERQEKAQRNNHKKDEAETFVPSKEHGKMTLGVTNPGSASVRGKKHDEPKKEKPKKKEEPKNKRNKKKEKDEELENKQQQQQQQQAAESKPQAAENKPAEKKQEFVEAKPPSTNFWEGRIKQQAAATIKQQQQQKEQESDSDRHHHKRGYDRQPSQSSGQVKIRRNEEKNNARSRIRSRDHPSDRDEKGSSFQKYREQKENNRKRQERPENGKPERNNQRKHKDDHPEKKLRRKDEGRKKESGSSTEDVRRNTARKQATDRGGKRRQDRTQRKHDRFKNDSAYEFPKPNQDDIKDAQVPNVEAIRGGLSFRGLMRQRGSLRTNRQRSSDKSGEETGSEHLDGVCPETEVIDATIVKSDKDEEDPVAEVPVNPGLNANAADFVLPIKKVFEPVSASEPPQISFIAAMPSPPANHQPPRQGIYGDTTANSPQLGARIDEANSNSPINVDESATLKKMELSRKAWDNAPSQRNAAQAGHQNAQASAPIAKEEQNPEKEFETSQGPGQDTSWPTTGTSATAAGDNNWSKGNNTQNSIPDAWSRDGPKTTQQDNWKKQEPMVHTPNMGDMGPNQLHGLNQAINQISFRNSGIPDQLTQMNQLLGSTPGYPTQTATQAPSQQLQAAQQQPNYQNFNAGFSYSNQQVYPSAAAAQLIQPNQISNTFADFGGQYLNPTNALGNSSFNSNLYANDQRPINSSDFGFNNHANNMMYSAFDGSMLANLQRQTAQASNSIFPQAASNGINNRYQNIQSNAFNALNMANQQQANQRPDLNNIRTSIGQPHHMQSSNIFGKSPSPSNPSLTHKLINPGFNEFNAFGPSAAGAANQAAAFRLNQSKQGRPNSSTPPHHHGGHHRSHHHQHHRNKNQDNFGNPFMNTGRGGFDSSLDSQKSYMSGNSEVFDPKMNQYNQFNRNQNHNQMNQFDQSNYFNKQSSGFGNSFMNNTAGNNGSSNFIGNGSGRNSRNGLSGNPANNQNLGGGGMNMRSGVIGTNFNDKKFGSVGSKLEQKMVNMEQKGRGNQVKKVKDFQLSQKEKNESQQALIGKVAEMTNSLPSKFGGLSLDKNGSGAASGDGPVSTPPNGDAETAASQGGAETGPDGEAPTSAENIVLNNEDRKRLTLADTAPKGGGIRRIITTDRS